MLWSSVLGITLMAQLAPAPQQLKQAAFVGFDNFSSFLSMKMPDGETLLQSPEIDAGIDWNEFVPSWNANATEGAHVVIGARAIYPDKSTKYFVMGDWSPDDKDRPRASMDHQKDDDGTVSTDTLRLRNTARKVQLEIVLKPGKDAKLPELRFLGAAFSNTNEPMAEDAPNKSAWGKVIEDVPQKCQGSYEGGGGWCSPTSLTMTLNYWGNKLNRTDLQKDVPEVAAGVFDKVFNGTGNWPFNSAYAGSFPGIRSYVTRFASINELENWIAAGYPVICSGNLPVFRGKPLPPNDPGHLVVLVGFTAEGDPVFNDPARQEVRQTYKRADFVKGWNGSNRTVYLVYPEDAKVPEDPGHHWFSK